MPLEQQNVTRLFMLMMFRRRCCCCTTSTTSLEGIQQQPVVVTRMDMIGEVVVGVDRGQPIDVKNMTVRRCRLSNPCWGRLLPERAAAAWISFLLYVWVALVGADNSTAVEFDSLFLREENYHFGMLLRTGDII